MARTHSADFQGPDFCYDSRVPTAGRASGNIEYEERCACGATRWVASNAGTRAFGDWKTPGAPVMWEVVDTTSASHWPGLPWPLPCGPFTSEALARAKAYEIVVWCAANLGTGPSLAVKECEP
jgi:hypothetical protein